MSAAMVLCAGFGTRLRPLTDSLPKPMLPVGDRAVVLHTLGQLQAQGFAPLVINTHHCPEAFDKQLPRDVVIAHEPRILGTAGGVFNARLSLGQGDVLVWNGDILAQPDLQALRTAFGLAHSRLGALATLLAQPRPVGQGTVGVGENGQVVRLRGQCFGPERSGADFIGIQIVSQRGRDFLPQEGCLVGDLYLPLLRQGKVLSVAWHRGGWLDMGSIAGYWLANCQWLSQKGLDFWAAPGASLNPHVRLVQSLIGPGAKVLGEGLLERCLLLPGASVKAPAKDMIVLADGQQLSLR